MRAHSYGLPLLLCSFLGAFSVLGQEDGAEGDGRSQPAVAATPVPAPAIPPVAPSSVAVVARPAMGGALSSGESDYVLVVGDVVELNIFR